MDEAAIMIALFALGLAVAVILLAVGLRCAATRDKPPTRKGNRP